ncbi:hypothetical protein QQX98_009709 [Neonectria punicea]|uniref:Uncharacterized protein n=1 Tax=Neonectria punicea TaxID=979145 RepID=A0ABR1GRL6_9HYPO
MSTWQASTANRLERRRRGRQETPDFDKALALQMYLSTPANVQHAGGCFHKGPLANSRLCREGVPQVFLKRGWVRERYRWILEGQGPHPNYFHTNEVQISQTRNPRRANVALPPPFRNRQWSPGAPTGFTEIETNLWTPGKFPNWPKPHGWQLDWPTDPTFIAQTQTQCEFCEDKACQCILTKVSRTRPKIVEAGEMGEGVQATQRYEVGEYIGELVPLNSVNNG